MSLLQNSNAITPPSGFELKSARFDDGSTPRLTRSTGTATSNQIFTISLWVKRGYVGSGQQAFFTSGNLTGGSDCFLFDVPLVSI